METEAPQEPQTAPETAPTTPEPPRYRLMAREVRRFDFPLSVEERASIGDRVAALGRDLRELERDHETKIEDARLRIQALKSECAEAAKERREAIGKAAEAFDDALAAHKTGIERRGVDIERRAIVASATIEIVRLDTGEVVESRPMTEAEQAKWCRQGLIEDVTGGATVKAGVVEEAAAPESDVLDEGEAAALGLPVGWPKKWRGKTWRVKDETLEEGDVHEAYLRVSQTGVTLDALLVGAPGLQGLDAMGVSRAKVGRALALLAKAGLVQKMVIEGMPAAWAQVDRTAPAAEPEPGRSDPLPEAGDAPRPKRRGPKTKADALIADAGGVAELYALPSPG